MKPLHAEMAHVGEGHWLAGRVNVQLRLSPSRYVVANLKTAGKISENVAVPDNETRPQLYVIWPHHSPGVGSQSQPLVLTQLLLAH